MASDEDLDSVGIDDAAEPEAPDTLAESVVAGDSFTPDDELFDAFGDPGPMRYVIDDGLPTAAPDESDAYCPPLTHEMFVCLGDERSLVIRDDLGAIVATFEPHEAKLISTGRFVVPQDLAEKRVREHAQTPAFRRLLDERLLGGCIVVDPIRPVCQHYLEQLDPPHPGEQLEYGRKRRYCTFRRTVAGAFMEFTDGAIRACSAREPYDVESSQLMRRMDEKKIEQGAMRTLYPMFALAPVPPTNGRS